MKTVKYAELDDPIVALRTSTLKRAEEGPSDEWIFEGLASATGFHGDGILVPNEVWREAIPGFMAFPNICLSHSMYDTRELVGRAVQMDIIDAGMFIRGMISKGEPGVWTKILEGIYRALSVNAWIQEYQWLEDKELFVASKVVLREVSIVASPADPAALLQPVSRGALALVERARGNRVAVPSSPPPVVVEEPDGLTDEALVALINSTRAAACVVKAQTEVLNIRMRREGW